MKIHNRHIGKNRSGEVVVRSMISSQLACVLTAIAPQLVVILNGFIVSNFLGVGCFKAISAFTPISGMVLMLINTCCVGPSIQAGKAYAELDSKTANNLFSFATLAASTIGVLSALFFLVFRNNIAGMITSEHSLQENLVSYIGPVGLYLLLSAIVCILNTFVTASGYVKRVTRAVIASCVMNVVSILILVKLLHFGIEAVGIAMCVSALTNIVILLPCVLGRLFPFRFVHRIPGLGHLIKDNASIWIGVNSGSLSEGLISFLINIVILSFLPSDGLFIWGICQMANNIIMFCTAGIIEAYLYINAWLAGEGDYAGKLKIAKSFLYEITATLVLIASILSLFTEKFAVLFGADTPQLVHSVVIPLICVVWFSAIKNILITFGIFSIQDRPAIKLSYDFIVAVATPVMVYLAAVLLGSTNLWLGFAITPLLLLFYVLSVNAVILQKNRNLIPFFLFNKINDVVTLDFSVSYDQGNMQDNLARIRTFLDICEIGDTLAGKIELCCEELMINIQGMHTNASSFDIRLSDCEDAVNLVVKNFGRSISPIVNNKFVNDFLEKGTVPDSKEVAMFYICHCCDKIEYHYVYGMNVVVLNFSKN